jgi:transcriptional regulator with GAF, ATPase, and Fis domain
MASRAGLLLPIWQEVCQHLDISESSQAVAALLREHLPIESIVVWRLERERRHVRIVAEPGPASSDEPGEMRLDAAAWNRLVRWVRRNESVHRARQPRKAASLLEILRHQVDPADAFLLPLAGKHGSYGVASALARESKRFTRQQTALLTAVRNPLSVALDNDARLHEIAALREAAEADRRSLLNRLGRKDVSDVIVGDDSGLEHVMQRVDMVSRSDVPVLILGETGTGKELVSRAIHNRSDRASGPFIRVNCGAIPRELIDSQLFGHEKGSFTGANETRQGWFERADRGTLFLDEIGELPLEAQVRFLRVLQDGFVERVGSTKPIRVNVRVVAATHRDLAAMVRQNTFREDLWYRIAVFPILLPPLRDRLEDIPALARHFAERAAIRFGLAPVLPSDADLTLLTNYDWPGNIRELGTVIDRAAILGNGHKLEVAAALGVSGPRQTPVAGQTTHTTTPSQPRSGAISTLDEAMRGHIEAALRATHGRVEGPYGVAKLLDINPHTLRARMRRLKIDWRAFRPPMPEQAVER